MSSLNKVTLIGHVGKDPDVRSLQNGNEIASFSLSTSERWKDKGGQRQEKTEWHNIIIFNKGLIGVVKGYVNKGSRLYVEGKLTTRKWIDKDCNDRYTTEVLLDNFGSRIILLDGRKGDSDYHQQSQSPLNDDIPF